MVSPAIGPQPNGQSKIGTVSAALAVNGLPNETAPKAKAPSAYQYEFSSLTYVTSRLRMLALYLIYQFSHESKASLKMFASIKI